MGAPKGNHFWKLRSKHGRDKIFSSPEILQAACYEYFEHVEATPVIEERVFCYQGEIVTAQVKHPRTMTLGAMCLYLGIDRSTWADYREKKDFIPVVREAEEIIWQQKFSLAAADQMNANLIARELGLVEKRQMEGSITFVVDSKTAACL